jgi:hypothetical protein
MLQNPIVLGKCQYLTYAFWVKTEPDTLVEARMVMNHRQEPWTSYGSENITFKSARGVRGIHSP